MRPVPGPIPNTVVDGIGQRLKKSILSPTAVPPYANDAGQRTYVENPYRTINVTGIGKAPITVFSKLGKAEPASSEYLLPDSVFKTKAARTAIFARDRDKPLTERTKIWLESARGVAEGGVVLQGYCNIISMITVAILVSDDSPLPKDTIVEWIGSGHGSTGHMAAVVNRDPDSDVTDPDAWGDNYLIVDYWYALQAGVAPIFRPRKKATITAKGCQRGHGRARGLPDLLR